MLEWSQSSGIMRRNGIIIGRGYSGSGDGKNNPKLENVARVGPIPKGKWKLTSLYHSHNVGPDTIRLEPNQNTDTFGRSIFRIHGDSIKHPGTASKGCIVLPKQARLAIWGSGDRFLTVVE